MKTCVATLLMVCMMEAAASEAPKITVNAIGSAKVLPTGLQVWVTLKGKAADAAGAVQALTTAQEKLAVKLAALGVTKEQLKSELPTVVDKAVQNAMRQQRGGQRLKRKPAAEEKPEVEMQQMVRAVVPLTAKDAAGILVEAEMLKGKIKAANLVDEKSDAAEGDDEESPYNQNNGQPTSAVNYMYFAPKAESVEEESLADALKKAAETAGRTAKAMGKAGIELHSVMVAVDSANQAMNQYYRYNRYGGYGQQAEVPPGEDGIASQTPQMTVTTQISAEYYFK